MTFTKWPVICLLGPTASGKTELAVTLVEKLACEIVSVDSVMVYRGFDIGSAKPDADVLARAPHKLIDVCDLNEIYSAATFRKQALIAIKEIIKKQRIPLLVGGSMLYFKTLINGIAPLPAGDVKVRRNIVEHAEKHGWSGVHRKLREVDPISAERIKVNDSQRLQRALEVWMLSGEAMSALLSKHGEPLSPESGEEFCFINIALLPRDRAVLHRRIASRFFHMLDIGFKDEVEALVYRWGELSDSHPVFRSAGYRQMKLHIQGALSYSSMIEQSLANTRQLAKRQLTWLRRWSTLNSFDCLSSTLFDDVLIFLRQSLPRLAQL